ncbi:MAG: hypothetical protein US20_C0005G0027 [Candidatus Pacebacteria bacterium GW2011_GWF1_36_5]|nr:MAG: hypothetical protein US20_C0005G0027 [Candidatus Pacebacteria bacterium GW2011_GWF1_36_5]
MNSIVFYLKHTPWVIHVINILLIFVLVLPILLPFIEGN